jgi:elongation factor P
MALLEYNEVKERKYIIHEGEPFEVLSSHVFRKQQRKPVNATKLKSLLSGRIVEHSFHVSDKVEEAELETKKVKYLYNSRGEFWFCEESDPAKRFKIEPSMLGDRIQYIKANSFIDALIFEEQIIGIKYPIKVELKITEAADAVKGNTVQGGSKTVTLETGATIQVPMFINQGEVIRINTETGDYVERVN